MLIRSDDGEPDTSRGVRPVLRGDWANLPQKCGKAALSYPTNCITTLLSCFARTGMT